MRDIGRIHLAMDFTALHFTMSTKRACLKSHPVAYDLLRIVPNQQTRRVDRLPQSLFQAGARCAPVGVGGRAKGYHVELRHLYLTATFCDDLNKTDYETETRTSRLPIQMLWLGRYRCTPQMHAFPIRDTPSYRYLIPGAFTFRRHTMPLTTGLNSICSGETATICEVSVPCECRPFAPICPPHKRLSGVLNTKMSGHFIPEDIYD
jgi:hypothetical protein